MNLKVFQTPKHTAQRFIILRDRILQWQWFYPSTASVSHSLEGWRCVAVQQNFSQVQLFFTGALHPINAAASFKWMWGLHFSHRDDASLWNKCSEKYQHMAWMSGKGEKGQKSTEPSKGHGGNFFSQIRLCSLWSTEKDWAALWSSIIYYIVHRCPQVCIIAAW